MTILDKPSSSRQKYRLTVKGLEALKEIKKGGRSNRSKIQMTVRNKRRMQPRSSTAPKTAGTCQTRIKPPTYTQRAKKFKHTEKFRMEAVRAGFKKAWQERDHATIIDVAGKILDNILQEDPKLLMWYDQAITRSGGE